MRNTHPTTTLRIVQTLHTTLAVSLLAVGLAACVAQSEPDPAGSNASPAETDLAAPFGVAPAANACFQSPRPTSRCTVLGGWHWCGCPDPDDPFPTGWVCGFCE